MNVSVICRTRTKSWNCQWLHEDLDGSLMLGKILATFKSAIKSCMHFALRITIFAWSLYALCITLAYLATTSELRQSWLHEHWTFHDVISGYWRYTVTLTTGGENWKIIIRMHKIASSENTQEKKFYTYMHNCIMHIDAKNDRRYLM